MVCGDVKCFCVIMEIISRRRSTLIFFQNPSKRSIDLEIVKLRRLTAPEEKRSRAKNRKTWRAKTSAISISTQQTLKRRALKRWVCSGKSHRIVAKGPKNAAVPLKGWTYCGDVVKICKRQHACQHYRFPDKNSAMPAPGAPIKQLAVLRLDEDLYESTMDTMVRLYPKLSVGGWAIMHDHVRVPACASAVTDFRTANGTEGEIIVVDWTGACWCRSK